jgi:F420-dependent oxidoreductase-like protein
VKLGLVLGYWGAHKPANIAELAQEAERLGFDSVWSAESWGSDAFSPLVWIAAQTDRIKLGTGVVQISARTPTATAMHALTLDHLSNGRVILGLGVSGPQVVEGWYGQPFGKPLARTREYVEIVRRVLAREVPLDFPGVHYSHPYHGPGSVGLGKPLKSITHPLRADVPIYLGAEGPKNVAMTAEIADGWLPLYYSPFRPEVYAESLAGAKPDFEIAALCNFIVTDDIEGALLPSKASLGFYIGGMGAEGANFHKNLMARMGYEREANEIQRLFLEGKRDEAIAMVPSAFADEISLVGPPARIRERLEMWEKSAVTTLNVAVPNVEAMRQVAEIVLGG